MDQSTAVISWSEGNRPAEHETLSGLGSEDSSTAGMQQQAIPMTNEAAPEESEIASAIETILRAIGEDPHREGLIRTPARVAKAIQFLTEGYHVSLESAVHNATFAHSGFSDLIVVKDIQIFSLCEHHLLPFTGRIHIGYVPCGRIIGLSKLARIAEVFSRRLQVQERLTEQVAHAVEELLRPKGVAVVLECSHMCMAMRGVRQSGTSTVTECTTGTFRADEALQRRFLALTGGAR